jgi:hypothetical protein
LSEWKPDFRNIVAIDIDQPNSFPAAARTQVKNSTINRAIPHKQESEGNIYLPPSPVSVPQEQFDDGTVWQLPDVVRLVIPVMEFLGRDGALSQIAKELLHLQGSVLHLVGESIENSYSFHLSSSNGSPFLSPFLIILKVLHRLDVASRQGRAKLIPARIEITHTVLKDAYSAQVWHRGQQLNGLMHCLTRDLRQDDVLTEVALNYKSQHAQATQLASHIPPEHLNGSSLPFHRSHLLDFVRQPE